MRELYFSYMFLLGFDFNDFFSVLQEGYNEMFMDSVSYIRNKISKYTKELNIIESRFIDNCLPELNINMAIIPVEEKKYCVLSNVFTPNNIYEFARKYFSCDDNLFCLVYSQSNDNEFNLFLYNKGKLVSKIELLEEDKVDLCTYNISDFASVFNICDKDLERAINNKTLNDIKNELGNLLNLSFDLTYDYVADNIKKFDKGIIFNIDD